VEVASKWLFFPGTPELESRNCPGLESRVGVSGLWTPISPDCKVWSQCGLKQSCSSCRELFKAVLHSQIGNWEEVESRLLVVRSQIVNLTLGPSFGHNLWFKCSNEQCKPILDIYVSIAFQWYQKRNNPLRFDPSTCPLKFWGSTGTPSPKMGIALGVWGLTPSHSPTLSYIPGSVWWLPGFLLACNLPMPLLSFPGFLPFGLQPCHAFVLTHGLPPFWARNLATPLSWLQAQS
jgi:hypothetical protein